MKNQFFKFILVGLVNTIFGYSIYSILIFMDLHYSVASLISTIVGVIFNFKSIGILVFKNNNNKLIVKFISVYVLTYFLNLLFLSLLKNYFNLYVSALILIVPLAIVSYVLNRNFVFKDREVSGA
jgi:putative flippase GtrA